MSTEHYSHQLLQPAKSGYALLLAVLLAITLTGAYCAYNMEHIGHNITGMNNQYVWGLPHVFAISLIVTASGALNGATMASVFCVAVYQPYARLSVVLSLVLLVGGLAVLVLDLGRPDRLVIALTTYNFRSVFSWNILLYGGFLLAGVAYLWVLIDRKFNRLTGVVGSVAFAWRIVLTTATGCIFGFLVGRSTLDSAILAPLFIALSFVMGTAALALIMASVARWQDATLTTAAIEALRKLLFWSVVALLYFSITFHLTNLYIEQHQADTRLLFSGSMSALFWLGHVAVGVILPLSIMVLPWIASSRRNSGSNSGVSENTLSVSQLLSACGAALSGGAVQVYIIVIGSQRVAQELFPGKTVLSSSFGDAGYPAYSASLWEWGLGIGGVSLSLLLLLLLLRMLPVCPRFVAHHASS